MRKFLSSTFLAAAVALTSTAGRATDTVPVPGSTYLIGGVGFEQLLNDGFTYNVDFSEVFGSVRGLYSDTTALGDPSATFPAAYVSRVNVYWDGTHLSSAWQGEDGLVSPGSVGGISNTNSTGEAVTTTRRTTNGDILYNKGLDTEGIHQFANPDTQVDRALALNITSGNKISFVLNTTGYALQNVKFSAFMQVGANCTITWGYSLDGASIVSTGVTTTISGAVPVAHSVDLSSLSGALVNDNDLVIVATLTGPSGNTVVLDNFQFIGGAPGGSTATAPTISGTPPSPVSVGDSYLYNFTITGSPAPALNVSGTLPPGISQTSTGLSGSPNTAGLYSGLNATVTNSAGSASLPASFSIEVRGAATVSNAPAAGGVGTAFTHTFGVGGYPVPTSVTLQTGTLPPGLSLTGLVLSGTPITAGSYTYTVRATNSIGSADLVVTHVINSAPTITPPASLTGVRGSAFSATFTLGGSPAPTAITLDSGTLPSGLAISGATISGTPGVAGSFPIRIAATNTAATTTLDVVLTIQSVPAITLPSSGSLTFSTLTPATADIVADGLPAPSVSATGLPAWLTLTSVSDNALGRTVATLSGTPPIGAASSYSIVFNSTNAAGSAPPQTLTLNIVATTSAPVISTQPVGGNVVPNAPFTFTVVASGVPTPTYQWRKDGAAIAGATSPSFTIANARASDAAGYSVVVTNNTGVATSSTATLVVLVPITITTQPVSAAVGAGDPVNLSVTATGLAPITYQWRRNGSPISGATSATFAIAHAATGDVGDYDVVVTNPAGSVTSSVAHVSIDSPPVITAQPAGGTFTAGVSVALSVTATSQSALTYRWRKDGVAITGADADSFVLGSAAETDSGSYTVVVTNSRGSVTSNAAVVVVIAQPQITTQPVSKVVVLGQAVTFEVTATPASVTYQWYRDGLTIDGATSPSLTVFDVHAAETQPAYTCRVTNLAGNVTSQPAYVAAYGPTSRVVPLTGGTFTVDVAAPASLASWSAVSDVAWLTPQKVTGGISYTVPAAPAGQTRSGKLTISFPGLNSVTHEVAQQEFVVLRGDFSATPGTPGSSWDSLGSATTAVVDGIGGRDDVLGLGTFGVPNAGPAPAATGFAAVKSRAALSANSDRRVQTDVYLAIDSADAGQAEAFLALVDPSASTTGGEPASGLRVSLWHGGPSSDARLRGHTWLTAQFKAADGKMRSLNLATALPADELAGRWVRLAADIGTDRRVSVWIDPEPFGDPLRVWTSSVEVSPSLLGTQSLLLGLRSESTQTRPYQSAAMVSGGFAPRSVSNRIIGISTRTWSGLGEQVAVAGFATSGGEAQLLVRGLGPMLTQFSVPGTLQSPRLVGYDGRTPAYIVRVQDAWEMQRSVETIEAISAAEIALGLHPLQSSANDAAFMYYPRGGLASQAMRTVHLKSSDGAGTGQALLELYTVNRTSGAELVAISTRAQVPKDVALIPGIALEGNATRLFLVRGIGPSLAAHGIAAPLPRTRLELYRGNRALLQNSGWSTAPSSTIIPTAASQTGAFALTAGSGDSAVVVRLAPGTFTMPITAATNGDSGVALAEIYALPLDAELDTISE